MTLNHISPTLYYDYFEGGKALAISCEAGDIGVSLQAQSLHEDHHQRCNGGFWKKCSMHALISACPCRERPAILLKRAINHKYFDISLLGLVILAFTALLGFSLCSA